MSPRAHNRPLPRPRTLADRIALELGMELREARRRRGWTMRDAGCRAGLTVSGVQRLEAGAHGSITSYARMAVALGLSPDFSMSARHIPDSQRDADPVHAAMGEAEATHLRERGSEILIDEPYQHYQFAGRADVLAIDRARRALLHIESSTRFPDLQAFAGSYNAKRAYLVPDLARRLGIPGGFRSVTHAVAGLWSSGVIHVVRLRPASFRAACPDPTDAFAAWWTGGGAATWRLQHVRPVRSPAGGRRSSPRRWVGPEAVATVEARYRGYADAVARLREARLA
jgi:transcriptional regulator with XRE-family HTH domain